MVPQPDYRLRIFSWERVIVQKLASEEFFGLQRAKMYPKTLKAHQVIVHTSIKRLGP